MEFFRQFVEGVRHAWGRLSLSAKANIVLAGVATAIAIGIVVVYGSRPQYVVLYRGLELDEAGQIQSYLDQENVPYRLQDGGQSILVPVRDRSRARVGLGQLNIPRSQGITPGFEFLDSQELLTNNWLQDAKYMRAVRGHLQTMLNEFEFVNRSMVFISEAPEELFIGEQQPSQAAVTLDVNRPLRPVEVKAVVNMVSAYGGANLHSGNITIATTDGTLLKSPMEDDFAAIASNRLEYKSNVERQIEEKIQKAFSNAGVRAVAVVGAEIDWTEERVTKSLMEEGVEISADETESTTTTRQPLPEGAPGVSANIPDATAGDGSTVVNSETTTTSNVEPSQTYTETMRPAGQATAYRVAVLAQMGQMAPVLDDEGNPTGETEYRAPTPETMNKFRSIALAAAGSVGEIEISDHPMEIDGIASVSATVREVEAAQTRDMLVKWGMIAGQVLLVGIGFVVVRMLLRRAMVLPPAAEVETVEMAEKSPEDIRRQEVAREVERLSMEEPETVAALIRSWMAVEED